MKFLTEYELSAGSKYSSWIYAKSLAEAEALAYVRGLNEEIVGTSSSKELEPLPSELFDNENYAECAHSLCFILSLLPELSSDEIVDNGVLHEVIHLSTGICIDLNSSTDKILKRIIQLERLAPGYMEIE